MDRARSKPSGGRFQSLVDHVYGPYPDDVFLEGELKPKPAADGYIDLTCVTLYAGKKLIGLDQSEFLIKPPETSFVHEDHPKHVSVTFCGIAEIRDLTWLSKQGRSFLERDVRNQDKIVVPHNKERRELSLEQVLNSARGERPSFKVYLMCRKKLLAHYLTAKSPTRQHELLIYSGSADGLVNRKFAVKSLHAETFNASKTFLARYRLRALLAELSDIDDHKTPVHLKDYNWVVDNYVTRILSRDLTAERRRKLRPLSEITPYADDLRYPRHIPRSQLLSELAEHSDWILANQIGKKGSPRDVRKNLVFIPSWVDWCNEAYLASIEAKRNGVKWGLSESVDLKNLKRKSLEQRLSKFGESPKFWESHLQTWLKCSKRYVEEDRDKPSLPIQGIQPPSTTFGGLEYDSDFSPDYTTSEWSDSDDVDISELRGPLKEVSFCTQPPQIPLGHFVWRCPGQDCQKEINLLDPSPQDITLLPPALARVLQTKRWSAQDFPIQQALAAMVSHHYQHEHLVLAGFHQVSTKSGARFRLSEALQKPNPHKRAMSLEIKGEDSS